jgi:hypothetical protein
MSDPATQRHVKQQRVAREELAEQPLRDSTSPPDGAQPLRDSTPPPDDAPRSPSEQTGGLAQRDPPTALPGNKRTKRGHYKYENDFEAKQARLAQRRECQARKKAADAKTAALAAKSAALAAAAVELLHEATRERQRADKLQEQVDALLLLCQSGVAAAAAVPTPAAADAPYTLPLGATLSQVRCALSVSVCLSACLCGLCLPPRGGPDHAVLHRAHRRRRRSSPIRAVYWAGSGSAASQRIRGCAVARISFGRRRSGAPAGSTTATECQRRSSAAFTASQRPMAREAHKSTATSSRYCASACTLRSSSSIVKSGGWTSAVAVSACAARLPLLLCPLPPLLCPLPLLLGLNRYVCCARRRWHETARGS